MDFKKFKYDFKNESFQVPSMNKQLKAYSENFRFAKDQKPKRNWFPLIKKSLALVPIITMILCVAIISIVNSPKPSFKLKTIKDSNDLQEVLNFKRDIKNYIIQGAGSSGWNAENKGDGFENIPPIVDSPDENDSINGDYSGTNTQEKDVDEADIVKTDGNKIFYYNMQLNTLYGYDLVNNKLDVIKKFSDDVKNYKCEMYLTNKYLIFIGINLISSNELSDKNVCIEVYDKNTYEVVKTYENDGNYITSRLTNNTLYFVYNQKNVSDLPYDYRDGDYHKYDYEDIGYTNVSINKGYTFIIALDVNSLNFTYEVLLGANKWTTVYCTKNNLYLALSSNCYDYDEYAISGSFFSEFKTQTNIYHYKLDGTNIKYNGIIITDGKVNNQFHLDEYDNHLRVVLDQGNISSDLMNKLEIYDLNKTKNNRIQKVASIDKGIGKERENIKSVRFEDNSCLIVTYVQIDPLYYIDLTNQLKPQIIGEYEEPGYNMYLHYINEKTAIGFGVGDTSLKVSLYELVNGTPNKTYELSGYNYIPVTTNHKALYIENNIFGFASRKYLVNDYQDTLPNARNENIYEIMEVYYENEKPLLRVIKTFIAEDNINQYERMIRVKDKYYLFSYNQIDILSSDFEIDNSINFN